MLKQNEEIHDLLGYDGIKIIQNKEMFRFSLDATLLANFVDTTSKAQKIIDLCSGNGPIPLFLSLKTKSEIIGIEIQEQVADMAKRSVVLNGLEKQVSYLHADLKGISKEVGANCYDIVTANPPYFKYISSSNINKHEQITIARHEVFVTLEEIMTESKKLLKNKGLFYLVHRAERLQEILHLLEMHKLRARRLQFVYPKESSQDAMIVLIEAQKGSKTMVKVEKPMYIHNEDGTYTNQIKKIFHFKTTI